MIITRQICFVQKSEDDFWKKKIQAWFSMKELHLGPQTCYFEKKVEKENVFLVLDFWAEKTIATYFFHPKGRIWRLARYISKFVKFSKRGCSQNLVQKELFLKFKKLNDAWNRIVTQSYKQPDLISYEMTQDFTEDAESTLLLPFCLSWWSVTPLVGLFGAGVGLAGAEPMSL